MPGAQRDSVGAVLMRCGRRLAAIAALWLGVGAFGTACFFAPRGSEAQPTGHDLFGFGCTLAIAGAVACAVALTFGGKWWLSGEILLAAALVLVILAVVAYALLWAQPLILRSRMDGSSFVLLREGSKHWAEQLAGFHLPLAATVGALAGVAAGILILFDRRSPRLAAALALALLVVVTSGPVQRTLFALIVLWGHIIHYCLVPGSMIADEISELATAFGAIAGAVISLLWARHGRRTAIAAI
jgi:hypothetical protein